MSSALMTLAAHGRITSVSRLESHSGIVPGRALARANTTR